MIDKAQMASRLRRHLAMIGEPGMKLLLITVTVIAYTILAAAWLCYTGVTLP